MRAPRLLVTFAAAAALAGPARATHAQSASAPAVPESTPFEAVSLLGDTLRRPPLAPVAERLATDQLDYARAVLATRPHDVDAQVWVARRLGYLGRYREAIDALTRSIAEHPTDARLYRHRGHRYLTVRDLPRAAADLERAAELTRDRPDEVEPDGQPNVAGVPIGTLQSNVWYHLALARYLQGDYARALAAADSGMRVSDVPDRLVSQTYWRYLILRRLGRDAEARAALAPIRADLPVIENQSYHRLLLRFKAGSDQAILAERGLRTPSDLAEAYGLSAFSALEGRAVWADQLRRQILASGQWPSFGYLAAEADEARTRGRR